MREDVAVQKHEEEKLDDSLTDPGDSDTLGAGVLELVAERRGREEVQESPQGQELREVCFEFENDLDVLVSLRGLRRSG